MSFVQLLRTIAICVSLSGAATATDIYKETTQYPTRPVDATYFGVHMHRIVVLPHERAIPTAWPTATFGSLRLWDTVTRWGNIAPKAGVWEFDRMDTFVNTGLQNKAEILYTLGSTPQWASARPQEKCSYGFGCGAEPVRLAHWEEYVKRVVQRYGNRITAYELWNEPKFSDFARDVGKQGFFTGSIKNMVDMAAAARKIIDESAPGAKLCTPGFVNGPDRLERFLAEGGAKHVQAICYHFYAEGSEHFINQVREVRAIMARQQVENLPLWNTETGVDTLLPTDPPSGIAERTREAAVDRLLQLLILGAATGMERFYYYAWDNSRSGMVSAFGQPLDGLDKLRRVQTWMLNSTFSGCSSYSDVISCTAYNGENKYMYVWSTKPTNTALKIPQSFKVAAFDRMSDVDSRWNLKSINDGKPLPFGSTPIRITLSSK